MSGALEMQAHRWGLLHGETDCNAGGFAGNRKGFCRKTQAAIPTQCVTGINTKHPSQHNIKLHRSKLIDLNEQIANAQLPQVPTDLSHELIEKGIKTVLKMAKTQTAGTPHLANTDKETAV